MADASKPYYVSYQNERALPLPPFLFTHEKSLVHALTSYSDWLSFNMRVRVSGEGRV